MNERQEQLILALEGAIIGVSAASDSQDITPEQICALLSILVSELKQALN